MADLTSAQHVGLFMFLWITGSVAAGESLGENATSGENVTLRCNSSTDAAITKVEWSRPELEDYVFYFSDNRLIESIQDPRYRGRVELEDPKMKNGNASVLLKNVSINDTGTYHCWVITLSNNRRKRNVRELVRSVHLTVSEGPEKHLKNGDANDEQPEGSGGNVGLGVGLVLVGLVVVVVVVGAGLVVRSQRAKVKRPLESFNEDLFTLDCPQSPASKLNPLRESLPCRGGGAYKPPATQTPGPGEGYTKCDSIEK
ncbi:uncharacterized protein LOC117537791 [Gymnodraco acuticeps]|uniref:Uncharacterized protein LOC117537791 n=1 Tax=Gymnodraco acuticeps TaxID=8218 RepID=A0A6P8TRE3_GYMAC|nr:uncharacterized protein LOC117537791 [Gymnodraco acuticeps]